MLTKQEIFIKVRDHLLAQNAKAARTAVLDSPELCMYRAPDGKMCAAGCLIKDEFYSPDLEGDGVFAAHVEAALLQSGVNMRDSETQNLVHSLQRLHDSGDIVFWKDSLSDIGRQFGLLPLEEIK